MQRYTTFFITVNALHVSGGFSAHHQELKNCTHSIGYTSSLLVATASVGELEHNSIYCVLRYRFARTLFRHNRHLQGTYTNVVKTYSNNIV
jgi:hypothetical protein